MTAFTDIAEDRVTGPDIIHGEISAGPGALVKALHDTFSEHCVHGEQYQHNTKQHRDPCFHLLVSLLKTSMTACLTRVIFHIPPPVRESLQNSCQADGEVKINYLSGEYQEKQEIT
jgi:hypothetical protein